MSNAFAVAAVTAALKSALRTAVTTTAVSDALGGPPVLSALPPDRVNPAGAPDPNQLNLFLYAVSENPGWRNERLPVRDARGERVDNQPLALDLYYLLTAYGTTDYGSEILLGHAMQALSEVPFFTRSWLTDTLKPGAPPNDLPAALETTGLPEQVEQIRITPTTLSLDDMSRIWSALQARYRTTASYRVTVVLIESARSRRTALPVQTRNIVALPWTALHIDEAVNPLSDTSVVTAGSILRLRGRGFGSADSQVRIMDVDLSAEITRKTETEMDVALPDPLPVGVRAGVIPVQVFQPTVGNAQFSSNAVGITLSPVIDPPTISGGKVTVTLSPKVTARQRVVLVLNERQPPAGQPGKAFSFSAPGSNGIVSPATETNKIVFRIPNVPAGTYVVRVQVDGADSPIQVDASGKFDKPKVTVS